MREIVYDPKRRMYRYQNEHDLTRFLTEEQFNALTKSHEEPAEDAGPDGPE